MRERTSAFVVGALCAGVFVIPGAAFAADKPGRPEIGTCKTEVDKVKATPKGKTAAEKKAAKKKMEEGGNQQALTSGVTIVCT